MHDDYSLDMSRTYRRGKIVAGRYTIVKNVNQEPTAFWWRHDHPKDRRKLNREYRRKNKQYFEKFGGILPYLKSRGWETW